jgi:hypothetical protein
MRSLSAAAVSLTLVLSGCGGSGGGGGLPAATPTPPPNGERLSTTGLYSAISTKTVASGVRHWTPQYPLWSDGGAKNRWILLPAGAAIDTTDMDRWVFPVGTKIWKEFSYVGRRVETRLIEKVSAGASPASWSYKSFRWLSDETDAVLASADGVVDASPTSFATTHDIPAVSQCLGCHTRGGDGVLGFDALQLSGDVDPLVLPDGQRAAGDLTVADLLAEGRLTRAPGAADRIQSSSAVGRWSMGFLHANCGNCHNPQGLAASSGMFLRHESAAGREQDEPAFATTVNQLTAVYSHKLYRVRGGSPDDSAIFFRMNTRADGDRMPPIGSKVVDADAANRIHDWIAALPQP